MPAARFETRRAVARALALALLVAGCGYHPLAGRAGAGRGVSVVVGESLVADRLAAEEMLQGAREALAREGALDARAAYPRLELALVRLDETAEGIAAGAPPGSPASVAAGGVAPYARGARFVAVGRARLVTAPGAAPVRDTGDVRATAASASRATALGAMAAGDETGRAAARALGRRLALLAVGEPAAAGEE